MSALVEFRNSLLGYELGPASPTAPGSEEQRKLLFVENICELFRRGEIADDLAPCSWAGTGTGHRKLAVDAGRYNPVDGTATFLLGIVGASPGEPATLSSTELAKNARFLECFVEEASAGGLVGRLPKDSPVEELRAEILLRRSDSQITKIKLFIVTDHRLSDRAKPPSSSERVSGLRFEFDIWDIDRLSELSTTGGELLEINLEDDFGVTIPCLQAKVTSDDYQAYLCVMPATLLADIYDRFGARLLETNVRGFLTDRGKVNSKIRETIRDDPQMFFAYNNGLTATASNVELDGTLSRIIKISNLQIVNGGQTTSSLFWAREKYRTNLEAVCVQMKLAVISAPSSHRFEDFVSNVAKFANSQNKVSDSDLFANNAFHREMDKLSKRVGVAKAGGGLIQTYWFYERARKQYENERRRMSKSELKKFDEKYPKTQLLDKTVFAKYWGCWEQLPHFVSRGAQKNFKRFADTIKVEYERNSADFNEVFFKRVVGVAIIYKTLESDIVREPWYDGYRINVLAYTLASVFRIAEAKGLRVNLVSVFSDQAISGKLASELLVLASRVYEFAKTCPARSTRPLWGHLGEWFKEEKCWDFVKNQSLQLPEAITPLLISAHQFDRQTADGVIKGTVAIGRSAQKEAQKLHLEGYWQKLSDWNQIAPVLTRLEVEALAEVAELDALTEIPDRIAGVLMSAQRRAEGLGFE